MPKSPKPRTIADFEPDAQNANLGTERGTGLLENVLRTLGAGRSILVDKNDKVLAGSHVLQACQDAGIARVKVVETNGQELVVVKRVDVSIDSKMGRELAIADNRLSELNLSWDAEALAQQAKEHGVDLDACGISAGELEAMLSEAQEQTKSDVSIEQLDTKEPPVMSWVLIGIPTVQFGSIAPHVEKIAAISGVVCETTVTSKATETPTDATEVSRGSK